MTLREKDVEYFVNWDAADITGKELIPEELFPEDSDTAE